MGDEPKIPKDVAYTIMTGYYPEIASKVKYGGTKKGRGRIGAKYARKRGFTGSSVDREEIGQLTELEKLIDPRLMITKRSDPMAKFTNKGFAGSTRLKYRFVGGSDQYKLYGDQVWYMAGVRDNETMLKEFLQDSDLTGPQYQARYKQAQPMMVRTAVKFAKEIFDGALDIAKLEEHFDSSFADSAEEMGFKDGDYSYMSIDEAVKKGYMEAKSSASKARERDMVKLDKNNNVVATWDVTEQGITQHGQHGIIDPPKELIEAIKAIEGGTASPHMEGIRQSVIKMYVNAITGTYNPIIEELKKIAGVGKKTTRKNPWDHILKSVAPKGKKAGTPDLARALNIKIPYYSMMDSYKKLDDQVGLEFVTHMLGTYNKDTNKQFAQTHRVATLPSGRKLYASVPMRTIPSTLLFDVKVVNDAVMLEGSSATTAIAYGQTSRAKIEGDWTSQSQKQTYTKGKVGANISINNTNATYAGAEMNLRRGLATATTVNIPSGPKMTKILNAVLNGAIPNLMKLKGMSSQRLASKIYSKSPQRKNMTLHKGSMNEAMFWALPYVGVMQSEHTEDKK
tara:strand:+ start:724 stop:2421 length:1698 start_codon:yes stop_codon:yes gene_type:complete